MQQNILNQYQNHLKIQMKKYLKVSSTTRSVKDIQELFLIGHPSLPDEPE